MKLYEQKEKFFFGVMHSTIIHRLVITNTGGRKEVLLVFIVKYKNIPSIVGMEHYKIYPISSVKRSIAQLSNKTADAILWCKWEI